MNPDSEETPKSKPECPSDQLYYTIGHVGIACPSRHTILIILKPEKRGSRTQLVQKGIFCEIFFWSKNNFGVKKIFLGKNNVCPKKVCASKKIVGRE